MLLFMDGQHDRFTNAPPAMRAGAEFKLAQDFPRLLQWRDWLLDTHWVPEGSAARARGGATKRA
jgi:hypothetical protein